MKLTHNDVASSETKRVRFFFSTRLPDEIHYDEMKNDAGEYEIGESSFGRDVLEVVPVIRVALNAKAGYATRKA